MIDSISYLLTCLALLLAIPVTTFLVEVVAAVALPQKDWSYLPSGNSCPRVAVLVPAHNEGKGLLPTLADIKPQLRVTDHILVVADNCTDDTASIAASAGADVIIRDEPLRKGKGYALAFGLRQLSLHAPDVIIVIDADCRLADGAIDRLAAVCMATHRPVQALDLMTAPANSPVSFKVAEFAWRLKNWVRPLGLGALGLPCQLMGTGMAFPWDVIRSVDLDSGSIVEDIKLGHDLALAGTPPVFLRLPAVTSEFPVLAEAAETQQLRWQQGHIRTILTAVPLLIFAAIRRADLDLLALAFDIAVPPLSLLGILIFSVSIAATLAAVLGLPSTAMLISTLNLVAFLSSLILAWWIYGRDILPPRSILTLLDYAGNKLFFYRRMFFGVSARDWTRTDRRKE